MSYNGRSGSSYGSQRRSSGHSNFGQKKKRPWEETAAENREALKEAESQRQQEQQAVTEMDKETEQAAQKNEEPKTETET